MGSAGPVTSGTLENGHGPVATAAPPATGNAPTPASDMSEYQMMRSCPASRHTLAPSALHFWQKSYSLPATVQMVALEMGGHKNSLLHCSKRLSGRPTQTSACLP